MKDVRLHYKMYKAGKRWIFASIAAISIGVGVAGYTAPVHADTYKNVENMSTSVGELGKTSSSADSAKAASAATSSSAASTKAASATTSSSADSTKAASTTTSSSADSTKAAST
ncbi:MAG: KxYKxGKxW signal peptide domain-containing protein, partial [Liquorilactobacillus satsumensis]